MLGIGICFPSLPAGKCIQRPSWPPPLLKSSLRFDSLQTGECIQSEILQDSTFFSPGVRKVSIPFKRESVFRETNYYLQRNSFYYEFQFPSNGKVYSKLNGNLLRPHEFHGVSVPFQRESVFRVMDSPKFNVTDPVFQFPSNGKVYSECSSTI